MNSQSTAPGMAPLGKVLPGIQKKYQGIDGIYFSGTQPGLMFTIPYKTRRGDRLNVGRAKTIFLSFFDDNRCEASTFVGEPKYDTSKSVPYWRSVIQVSINGATYKAILYIVLRGSETEVKLQLPLTIDFLGTQEYVDRIYRLLGM